MSILSGVGLATPKAHLNQASSIPEAIPWTQRPSTPSVGGGMSRLSGAAFDVVHFGAGGPKAPRFSGVGAVHALEIPYEFRVYRREKNKGVISATGEVARNYFPRTLKPENLAKHIQGAQLVALGDLHGSYQKLVEVLLATGLASMPPNSAKRFKECSEAFIRDIQTEPLCHSPENPYRRFVFSRIQGRSLQKSLRILRMYGFSEEVLHGVIHRQQSYQKHYRQLQELIQQLRWTGQPGQQLLLIGDVLSDRGPLDFLTLDVIDQIRQGDSQRLITLASNHDHAGMQTLIYNMFPMGWATAASLGRSMLMASEGKPKVTVALKPEGDQVRLSLKPGWNPGSRPDYLERYKRFVENSQLVHYRPETQTLFTHAPINPMEIAHLNDVLSQRYLQCAPVPQTDSKSARAQLKDVNFWQTWANRFWQRYAGNAMAENKLSDPVEDMLESLQGTQGFLWCRDALKEASHLPFVGEGVQALVHGHDRDSEKSPFSLQRQLHQVDPRNAADSTPPYTIFNLDQDTRKVLQPQENAEPCSLYVEF